MVEKGRQSVSLHPQFPNTMSDKYQPPTPLIREYSSKGRRGIMPEELRRKERGEGQRRDRGGR